MSCELMGSAGKFLDILMQLQSDFRLDWSHPKIDWAGHSEWLSHMVDSSCSAGALQSSCMWPVQVIGLLTARQLSSDRRVPQADFTGTRKLVPRGRKGYCWKWQSTISARPFWPSSQKMVEIEALLLSTSKLTLRKNVGDVRYFCSHLWESYKS